MVGTGMLGGGREEGEKETLPMGLFKKRHVFPPVMGYQIEHSGSSFMLGKNQPKTKINASLACLTKHKSET